MDYASNKVTKSIKFPDKSKDEDLLNKPKGRSKVVGEIKQLIAPLKDYKPSRYGTQVAVKG